MPTPLKWNAKLPNGDPVRWNQKGAVWNGTLEAVVAEMESNMPRTYKFNQAITEAQCAAYIAKLKEADDLIAWVKTMVPGAEGKLNTIGVERAGVIEAFLRELAAHPEFMPSDIDPAHAPAKAVLIGYLKRMLDEREDGTKRLKEAIFRACDDFMFDGNSYYDNTQGAAKRLVPNASISAANLKPYFGKAGRKKAKPTPPANS